MNRKWPALDEYGDEMCPQNFTSPNKRKMVTTKKQKRSTSKK